MLEESILEGELKVVRVRGLSLQNPLILEDQLERAAAGSWQRKYIENRADTAHR